jgi:LysM repeat protein
MKFIYTVVAFMFLFSMQQTAAQESYNDRAKKYIKQYAAYAIADQRESGVPAAITLGQGILETDAGISELVTGANNHFGIKCKKGWQGPSFLHTDDAKNECFKKYKNALESYNDHSAHLHRNPRYKILFNYSVTDYARWAHGLKKCGYATNPRYAYQLIKIIEEFRLQEYTYAAADSLADLTDIDALVYANTGLKNNANVEPPEEETSDKQAKPDNATKATQPAAIESSAAIKDTVIILGSHSYKGSAGNVDNSNDTVVWDEKTPNNIYPAEEPLGEESAIKTINGLKAIVAKKGDVLLQYAIKYNIRYAQLLDMNDMPDEPLAFDSYIYLEKKNITGNNDKHTVKQGETLLMVAQTEGIQLKKLATLNLLNTFEQPVTGAVLELKTPATTKPAVEDYKQKPIPVLENTSVSASEEMSFGMSFEAPAEDAKKKAIEQTYNELKRESEENTPPPAVIAKNATPKAEKKVIQNTYEEAEEPIKKTEKEPVKKGITKYYVVKKGETAFSIAKRNEVTVAQLEQWNAMKAKNLKAGQKIIVKK